jgi:hypothetical protein
LSKALRTIDWPFLGDCPNIRGQYRENRTKGLYQWLTQGASFFRSEVAGRGTSRTVRTEVTVEQQGLTLLMSGSATGFADCPLCGQKLEAGERAASVRLEGSVSLEGGQMTVLPPEVEKP